VVPLCLAMAALDNPAAISRQTSIWGVVSKAASCAKR
jgi:hypothetical protein